MTLNLHRINYVKLFGFLNAAFLLLIIALVIAPVTIGDSNAIINSEVYSLGITTDGDVNLTTTQNQLVIGKSTIYATTASPAGYKLYISTNDSSNIIYHNGTDTGDINRRFSPTLGTQTSPIALTGSTWGYAIAGLGGFDSIYNPASPNPDAKFAAVPVKNSEQLIHTHTGIATNAATDVFFGFKASSSQIAGRYSTTVLYTTLSEDTSMDDGEINITGSPIMSGYSSASIAVRTSLATSRNLGAISVMVGDQSCNNIVVTSNNPLSLNCELPTSLVAGMYDIVVNVAGVGSTYAATNGLVIEDPEITFVVQSSQSDWGTVSPASITAGYGSNIVIDEDKIIIGTQTATAVPSETTSQYIYSFDSWTINCGSTLTKSCTIVANFTRISNSYDIDIAVADDSDGYGIVSTGKVTVSYETSFTVSGNQLMIGDITVTATPNDNTAQYTYAFVDWTHDCESRIVASCTAKANFVRTNNIYTVFLNNQSATSAGTSVIYEQYGVNYSLASGGAAMSAAANPITVPARSYTYAINYDMGDTGVSAPSSPISITRTDVFNGYYTATTGGTQYIGADGYLASTANNTGFAANSSLYAQWTDGSATITLPTLSKTGYACKWAQNTTSGTPYVGGTSVTITEDTTFYAICSANTYAISLNNQSATSAGTTAIYETYNTKYSLISGGAAMSTSTNPITKPVRSYTYTIDFNMNGTGITAPSSPTSVTRVDTFNGYYTATSGGTQYIGANGYLTGSASTTAFTASGTLYAQWANGSATITLPALSKTGHTCKWAQNTTSGTLYVGGASVSITANSTFYAICSANTYTVSLNNQSATSAGTTTIYETYNTKYSLTSGGTAMSTSANPITKPIRSYTYTIGYNMNGTGITAPSSPTSATRADTFNGYYTATSGGTQYIGANGYLTSSASTTAFTANGTLYARWANSSATTTLPVISKIGYTCQWAAGSAAGTKYNGGAQITLAANTTMYAVCTANNYTVTIARNNTSYGTTSTTTLTLPYGTTFSASGSTLTFSNGSKVTASVTAATGYTTAFSSWSSTSGTITGNTTITANFSRTANTYTISLNNQSATSAGTTAIYETYNSKYSLTSGGTAMSTSANPITKPTKTYTISYNANSQGASYAASPTSSSATFGGYYTSTGGAGTQYIGTNGYLTGSASTTAFTANGTLYAKWTNTTITLPAISRTGYTCQWAAGSTAGTRYNGGASVTISANTTFYAACTVNNYTVTWNANGGSVSPTSTTKAYGSQIGTLPTPTYTDHEFQGWFTAATGGTQIATTTTITGNVTYYAQWKVSENYTMSVTLSGIYYAANAHCDVYTSSNKTQLVRSVEMSYSTTSISIASSYYVSCVATMLDVVGGGGAAVCRVPGLDLYIEHRFNYNGSVTDQTFCYYDPNSRSLGY